MFYAHFVLAKKGPLAKIWLAAHWDKKLTKAHVFETNIEKSVDGILKPKVKMALRTSGHLLLGVVRIYSRKAKYLLADCNEAFVKIKMAFRPGMVDLPEEHREAAMNAITLPEVFHDFDTAIPELNDVDIEAQFSLNQSRAEEITMREDYGSLNMVTHDDGFGDIGFDADGPDMMRDAMGPDGSLEQSNLLFGDGTALDMGHGKDSNVASSSGAGVLPQMVPSRQPIDTGPPPPMDDGFGGTIGDDFGHAGGLFEGDLFGDVTASGSASSTTPGLPGSAPQQQSLQAEIEAATAAREGLGVPETPRPPAADRDSDDDDDMGDHYDGGMSPAHSWDGSQHDEDRAVEGVLGGTSSRQAADLMPPPSVAPPLPLPSMEVDEPIASTSADIRSESPVPPATPAAPAADQTTLLQNEDESFALPPVDQSILKGITKTKRKRKLIVDEVKNISGEEMKNQLSNTKDIVTTLDLAPPTKLLMHWKETGGVEKLFTLAARPMPSKRLFKLYQRNMFYKTPESEEGPGSGPASAQEPEQPLASVRPARNESPERMATRRSGRKRKVVDAFSEPELPPPEMEPPTPIPHDYLPSVETPADFGAPATPGYPQTPGTPGYPQTPGTPGYPQTPAQDLDPHTPGGILSNLGPLTPGVLGPLTPDTLLHGGITPGGLQHGDLTPGGLQHGLEHGLDAGLGTPGGLTHGGMTPSGLGHGGLTPAGLVHGGLTPAGLGHGGMTPAGLGHGGMTPAGLGHGGMTPVGLGHGGMTPAGLHHGGLTPAGLHHGGMTPAGLHHIGLTPAGLHHGGMTPVGLHHGGMTPTGLQHGDMLHHGGMTPAGLQHGMVDDMPMMPHLPGDQVSHFLGDSEVGPGVSGVPPPPPAHDLEHTVPMEPLSLHNIGEQTPHYQTGIGVTMANMGYDDTHAPHSPQDDYELPPSVDNADVEAARQADETEEQFSERVLNRRAGQLFAMMRPRLLESDSSLKFSDLTNRHNTKKIVAQKFYSLLVLKKFQVLQLQQDEAYGDIIITRGNQFETEAM